MKTSRVVVLFISVLLSSCSSMPQVSQLTIDKLDVMRLKDFKYGNYCGAGHPAFASTPGTAQRLADLKNNWPPIDDIDVMCYSHDLCYELTSSQNAICDDALISTSAYQGYTFDKESGCKNLARVITSGIGVKVKATEKDEKAARTQMIVNTVARIPLALQYFGSDARDLRQYGLPESHHKCFGNGNGKISPHYYITYFEESYISAAKTYKKVTGAEAGKPAIILAYIGRGSSDPMLVSQIQQYLTKFDYDIGPADGILGSRTKNALASYLENTEAHKLTEDGTPNHKVLAHMKYSWKFAGSVSNWINKKVGEFE